MVWFMDINLTDNRTTVGSYDNRSSGGVLLMPKERHMREGAPIQPHAHALQCAKPAGRFAHCLNSDKTKRGFLTTTRSQPRLGLVVRCGDLTL